MTVCAVLFQEEIFDCIDTTVNNLIAPVFGSVVALYLAMARLFELFQCCENGVGVAGAQQLAYKQIMSFKSAAFVLDFMRQRDGLPDRLVE